MTTDDTQPWEDLRAERQRVGLRRRQRARADFPAARSLADRHGMNLHRCSEVHYQLTHTRLGWQLNIYPGNQRLCWDRYCRVPPFVRTPKPWTLVTVVLNYAHGAAKERNPR